MAAAISFGLVREVLVREKPVKLCLAEGWAVKQVMPSVPLVLSLVGNQRVQLEHISGMALPVDTGCSQTNICSPFCEQGTAEGLLEDGPNPNASPKASLLSVPALTWFKYCCHQ